MNARIPPSHASPEPYKPIEIWRQDPSDGDLWHRADGLIVNRAALDEREPYFAVVRERCGDSGYGQERWHPTPAPC